MPKKLFKKGEGGRKKGSRNKRTIEIEELRSAFISAIYRGPDVFDKAFQTVLDKKPLEALRVVASVIPKDIKIDDNRVHEIRLIHVKEKDV